MHLYLKPSHSFYLRIWQLGHLYLVSWGFQTLKQIRLIYNLAPLPQEVSAFDCLPLRYMVHICIIKTKQIVCMCPCNRKYLCPLQFLSLPDTYCSSTFARSTVPQAQWEKPYHKGRSSELLPFSSFTPWTFCNLSISHLLWTDYHLLLLIKLKDRHLKWYI